MTDVVLATEEEGIGLLAGAWLGGERGVLLMQSSGVGNCINTLSMIRTCQFPLLLVVTMRGEWGETNPWQLPMAKPRHTTSNSPASSSGASRRRARWPGASQRRRSSPSNPRAPRRF